MARALRWGICSAGLISHDLVVGMKTLPESEHQVVAVAARSLESASKFTKTHSIPRYYGSYQELANDTEVEELIYDRWGSTFRQNSPLMVCSFTTSIIFQRKYCKSSAFDTETKTQGCEFQSYQGGVIGTCFHTSVFSTIHCVNLENTLRETQSRGGKIQIPGLPNVYLYWNK